MVYIWLAVGLLGAAGIEYAINQFSSPACLWQLPLLLVGLLAAEILLFLIVLIVSTLFVNPKKLCEKPSAYFRFMLTQFCRIALRLGGVRIHTAGLEKLPRTGRFMLVCNHAFAFDPLIFYAVMPQAELAFLAKKELFSIFAVAPIMRKVLCLPLDRDNDREALKAILKAIQFIREDKASIAVFPEGGTNRTEAELLPFRNGAFKIAQKTQVPIVVCSLVNSRAIRDNMFRRRTDVYLDVLDVVAPDALAELRTAEIGDEVHAILLHGLQERKAAIA